MVTGIIARARVAAAPTLVPIYSHRYIPAEPLRVDNPVLSVQHADVICYGENLRDYLDKEFGSDGWAPPSAAGIRAVEAIPLWGGIVLGRHQGGL